MHNIAHGCPPILRLRRRWTVRLRRSLQLRPAILLGALLLLACSEQTSVDYEIAIPAQWRLQQEEWNYTYPFWHPQGGRLLFCARATSGGPMQLREVTLTTRQERLLLTDSSSVAFPAWSPDAQTILFTSSRAGDHDLWLFTPATAFLRRITSLPGHEEFPRWSPDGKRIAFLSLNRICLYDVGLGTLSYLPTPALLVTSLGWSPDGRRLLFSADDGSGDFLYGYDLAANSFAMLLDPPQPGSWPGAAASAATDQLLHLAWQRPGGGSTQIWFYRTGAAAATLVAAAGAMPAWSPDGTMLAYARSSALGTALVCDTIWIGVDE